MPQMTNFNFHLYMRHPKVLTAAILTITTIWLLSGFRTSAPHQRAVAKYPATNGPIQFQPHGLQKLSTNVEIASFHIQAAVADTNYDLVTDISRDLPAFWRWDQNGDGKIPPPDIAVEIHSSPNRTDASWLVFGLATTLRRLDDSLETFAHWAGGTGATIVVLIPNDDHADDKSDLPLPRRRDVMQKAADLEIKLHIEQGDNDFIKRYVSLLETIHKHANKIGAKWVCLMDDDTFYPSISRLAAMLRQYDPSKLHYLGALSEDFNAVKRWGLIAFGGGGIFLSKPLLDRLQPFVARCIVEGVPNGDGKLARCINRYTTTGLTVIRDLYQMDLNGDPTGFYEAVRSLPLSVHHYKGAWNFDMKLMSAISTILGEDQVFAKFHTRDGWWITNGFSVVKYSEEIFETEDPEALEWYPPVSHREGAMEKTFYMIPETPESYADSLSPLAPKDDGKVQYMIEAAVRESRDVMSLYYVRRVDGIGESVIRIIWSRLGP